MMLNKYLIGLHGQPRHGKDTLAVQLISYQGFSGFYFAEGVYKDLSEFYGVSIRDLNSTLWKTQPQDCLALLHCGDGEFRLWAKEQGLDLWTARTSREVMQIYGNDYRCGQNPSHWVDQLEAKLRVARTGSNIVVTDVRKPRIEFEFLKRFAAGTGRTFLMVEVQKQGESRAAMSGHITDQPFPEALIDIVVTNIPGDMNAMYNELMLKVKSIAQGTANAIR